MGGIEPPTRGFSDRCRWFWGLNNQPLAALAAPHPSLTKAHSWHTQSELVTFLAHGPQSCCSTRMRDWPSSDSPANPQARALRPRGYFFFWRGLAADRVGQAISPRAI